MDDQLEPVATALAALEDSELRALVVAANELVLMAAGLLSWIEHLADWELNRRSGLDLPLQPPEAAIAPEEGAESIVAATMMREDSPRPAVTRPSRWWRCSTPSSAR